MEPRSRSVYIINVAVFQSRDNTAISYLVPKRSGSGQIIVILTDKFYEDVSEAVLDISITSEYISEPGML